MLIQEAVEILMSIEQAGSAGMPQSTTIDQQIEAHICLAGWLYIQQGGREKPEPQHLHAQYVREVEGTAKPFGAGAFSPPTSFSGARAKRASNSRPPNAHDAICKKLVQRYAALGLRAEAEKMFGDPKGRHGYADVFVTSGVLQLLRPAIVEVKTRFEQNPIGNAARQLQFYRTLYNADCDLLIVCGFKPDPGDVALAESAGIAIIGDLP